METNFVIKEGEKTRYYYLILCLFLSILWASNTGRIEGLFPLVFLLITVILAYSMMIFRWMTSFAVYLDVEKQEIILNHTLFFKKKKILLKDIKEIDMLNGSLILDASFPLSKCQRIVCKTKKSDDYTVRFETIDACERRQLMETVAKYYKVDN